MAVDISEELFIIDNSKSGMDIKAAIWNALYALSQAEPSQKRGLNISIASDVQWGLIDSCVIGIATEEEIT